MKKSKKKKKGLKEWGPGHPLYDWQQKQKKAKKQEKVKGPAKSRSEAARKAWRTRRLREEEKCLGPAF